MGGRGLGSCKGEAAGEEGGTSWDKQFSQSLDKVKLCTVYCVLCTVYCVLCTFDHVLCTVYCEVCTLYCVLVVVGICFLLFTVYADLCTLYCVLLMLWVTESGVYSL